MDQPAKPEFQCCICGRVVARGFWGERRNDPCSVTVSERADEADADHRPEQFFCHYRCFWQMYDSSVAREAADTSKPPTCGVCGQRIRPSDESTTTADPCGLELTLRYDSTHPMTTMDPFYCHLDCLRKVIEPHLAVPISLGTNGGAT